MRKPGAVMTRVIQAMLERRDLGGLKLMEARMKDRADRAYDRGCGGTRWHMAWQYAGHAIGAAAFYLERHTWGDPTACEMAARATEMIMDFRKLREPDPERSGVRGDREEWSRGAVFKAADVSDFTDGEIIAMTGFHEYGQCAGRPFAHEPWLYRRGSRVVVKWSGGLDV